MASSTPPTGRRLLPVLLMAAALLVGVLAVTAEADRRERRRQAVADLDHPVVSPALREELTALVERQDDPDEVRLLLARHLVARVLDASLGDPGERRAAAARMELAGSLAASAWARRPADVRGPTMLGASTYLARSLARDRRLVTEAAAWDAPLTHARELAPGAGEPVQITVTAYLELWPMLSPEKRAVATDLLQRAFRNPGTFARLLGPWLRVAGDREEALAAVPERPEAWSRVARALAAGGDTEGFLLAHERWRDALAADLDQRLARAVRLERAGDAYAARRLYLEVIADAPTDRAFAPRVERALARIPAGPPLPSAAPDLTRWLTWSLDLFLAGSPPLSPEAIDRLAGQVHDLPLPLAAHAAVVAGRLPRGERLERRAYQRAGADAWGGYLVAKAAELLRRGHPREALASLDRAGRTWRDRPSYLRVRVDAARAAGDDGAERRALERLREVGATGGAWLGARAELWLARGADGLTIHGRRRGGGGPSLVELRLDGRRVLAGRVRGDAVRLPLEVTPGLHLVEVVPLAGAPFLPLAAAP